MRADFRDARLTVACGSRGIFKDEPLFIYLFIYLFTHLFPHYHNNLRQFVLLIQDIRHDPTMATLTIFLDLKYVNLLRRSESSTNGYDAKFKEDMIILYYYSRLPW